MVPGTNTGPWWGAEETPSGHWNTCRPETGSTWWVTCDRALLNIPHDLNAPYPTTPTLVTESKMIEKHGGYKFTAPVVPSSFNFGGSAPGMNWITCSTFYYSVTDCSEVKKACVVPLSSGSRTGFSQSFFNLSDGENSTRRCGKATKMQPMAGNLSVMQVKQLWTLFSGAQDERGYQDANSFVTFFFFLFPKLTVTNWQWNYISLSLLWLNSHKIVTPLVVGISILLHKQYCLWMYKPRLAFFSFFNIVFFFVLFFK